VGEFVEAMYKRSRWCLLKDLNEGWHVAKVLCTPFEEGTQYVNVKVRTGEDMTGLTMDRVRSTPQTFEPGTPVLAVFNSMWGGTEFLRGEIQRKRGKHRYDIFFENGETEELIHRLLIRTTNTKNLVL
jgi:hypothetical protein